MKEKPEKTDYKEVKYTDEHWRLLHTLRERGVKLLSCLETNGLFGAIVHGSIVRGDVHLGSDVDAFIPRPIAEFQLDAALSSCTYKVYSRVIVQATPAYAPKVYFILDPEEKMMVSYPLVPLEEREREFYKWGGEAVLEELQAGMRKPGVNKALALIIPKSWGHVEVPVEGNESYVAQIIGVSLATVMERVRVLRERREKGVSGPYLTIEVAPEENVSSIVKKLASENPIFRRILAKRGYW
ncbi:MAG: DNA polymerase subunit beta [Desulfurococcales archaeon]|nr:DNA polymerase subunit beta [Desulfurococcales archaeon]